MNLLAVANDRTESEAQAIALVVALVNSGRVVLTGNFRGQRFALEG